MYCLMAPIQAGQRLDAEADVDATVQIRGGQEFEARFRANARPIAGVVVSTCGKQASGRIDGRHGVLLERWRVIESRGGRILPEAIAMARPGRSAAAIRTAAPIT